MIDKLELLLALSRERHFSRAAESCGVSQPTLSASLKSLEEQLGVLIVERGSRFIGFTPEGERILDWARRIVGDARTMRQEIDALKMGMGGNLRLGVIPTALPFVPNLSLRFKAKHAGVGLAVIALSSDAILSKLDDIELDIGISYIDTEPLQRFQTVQLYEERYALLVSPDSPLAKRESITWAEAATVPLVLLTKDMQNRRIIDRHLAESGHPAAPSIESNSMMMLHVHVRTGGWATIAALGAGHQFDPPMQLKALALTEPTVTHQIGLILKSREPHPPPVSAFLACARRFEKERA